MAVDMAVAVTLAVGLLVLLLISAHIESNTDLPHAEFFMTASRIPKACKDSLFPALHKWRNRVENVQGPRLYSTDMCI